MNRLLLLLGITITLSTGCQSGDGMPAGVLKPEKMEKVLWDMMKTGEYLQLHVLFKDTSIDKVAASHQWYEKMFKLHDITKEQFDKSFLWYRQHPDKLVVLMDSIAKRKPYQVPATDTAASATGTAVQNSDLMPDTIGLLKPDSVLVRPKRKRTTSPVE